MNEPDTWTWPDAYNTDPLYSAAVVEHDLLCFCAECLPYPQENYDDAESTAAVDDLEALSPPADQPAIRLRLGPD